jgi:hypothetical protein
MSGLHVEVIAGDLLDCTVDVVVLKHAQGFYVADGAVADRLKTVNVARTELEVPAGQARFFETRGSLKSPLALFVGTVSLPRLGYHELRQFSARVLQALEARPTIKRVAFTVHGASYGLDEAEAVLALVGGLVEAFQRGVGPASLEQVLVVEKKQGRAARLKQALESGLDGTPGVVRASSGFYVTRQLGFTQNAAMASAGTSSSSKPHAFVAMPFTAELEDVFHYGIQGPVKSAGLLCERVDQAVFDGLIIARIRERIEAARVVVADLSYANPNVYLEVGYAWGRGRPTILLVRDVEELRFDVKAHRCLVYRSIRDLEQSLARELAAVLQGTT